MWHVRCESYTMLFSDAKSRSNQQAEVFRVLFVCLFRVCVAYCCIMVFLNVCMIACKCMVVSVNVYAWEQMYGCMCVCRYMYSFIFSWCAITYFSDVFCVINVNSTSIQLSAASMNVNKLKLEAIVHAITLQLATYWFLHILDLNNNTITSRGNKCHPSVTSECNVCCQEFWWMPVYYCRWDVVSAQLSSYSFRGGYSPTATICCDAHCSCQTIPFCLLSL